MNNRLVSSGVLGAVVVSNVAVVVGFAGLQVRVSDMADRVDRVSQEVAQIKQAELVRTKHTVKLSKDDKLCLARNIFFEAGVEPHIGKIAVAQVTYNRLQTGRWGTKMCDVVYAKAQFSWTAEKSKRWTTPKGELWDRSLRAVDDFKRGVRVDGLDNSLFYHADYVDPFWKDPSKKIDQIGRHIFYTHARRT